MSRCASIAAVLLCLASAANAARWTQTGSIPDGYSDHAVVFWNGYFYQTGGSSATHGPASGTNVFYTQLQAGGLVGVWNATTSLPVALLDHASVAANGFVYVIGGESYSAEQGETVSSAVYYAATNSNGSLGAWQTASALPYPAYLLSASVWNNTIYISGGTDDINFYNGVYSATIQTNGSLSAWTQQASLPAAVAGHAQVANGVLYVIGGSIDDNSEVTANVYYSKINPDGSLAGWTNTTVLPSAWTGLGALAAGGQIYTLGGWNPSGPTNEQYVATVLGGGPLEPWTAGTALPAALYSAGIVSTGSYIFVTGGLGTNGASSLVFSMPLPSPPATPVLSAPTPASNGFQFTLSSTTSTGFGILASANLINWTNIGYGFTGTNGSFVFQDTNAANFSNRFYQAYWPLP